ncbi:hypothetical protein GCM10011608_11400 [Micromonospora sonchi]|uniref:Uncharacterized protein n=1 Tax=Micromonospora sonchi TaxID=1763543 RepID=A0A917TN43_9ACTN|nr:hypothetical protein GCM10011608_11400 [Micromonospora sonchi]
MISDLRESLTRRATYENIDASPCLDNALMDIRKPDVSTDELSIRKIECEGSASVWVDVAGTDNLKSSLLKPLGESAGAGEQVQYARLPNGHEVAWCAWRRIGLESKHWQCQSRDHAAPLTRLVTPRTRGVTAGPILLQAAPKGRPPRRVARACHI